MFSDDIWDEAIRMYRTLEEGGINVGAEKEDGGLAVGAEKEEGGLLVGAKEAVTGELEVDNL